MAKKKRLSTDQVSVGAPGQLGWQPVPGVTLERTLRGHQSDIYRIAWSPDGQQLATPSDDKTIRIWNTASGAVVREFLDHHASVHSVAWSPDGSMIASAAAADKVRVWKTSTGERCWEMDRDKLRAWSVAWSPDGSLIAIASGDGTIWFVDTETFKSFQVGRVKGSGAAVAWSPDGRNLASPSGEKYDRSVRVWDATTGVLLHQLNGHKDRIVTIAWSPSHNGQYLASAGNDGVIRIWDLQNGRAAYLLEGHAGGVRCVAFSHDGKLLASKGGSGDNTIRLWRCDSWRLVATLPEPGCDRWPPGISFHPHSHVLATVGSDPGTQRQEEDRVVHLWKLDLDFLLGKISAGARSIGSRPILNPIGWASVAVGARTGGSLGAVQDEHYRNAKVVLVGNSSVGKSGLGLVLAGRKFRATESTHGRHIWTINSSSGDSDGRSPRRSHASQTKPSDKSRRVKRSPSIRTVPETRETLLWDLAGQPGYRLVHQLHLGEVAVGLVLFDARSETEPFGGVAYWARALDDARRDFPLKKYLIAARCDRGGATVSQARIDEFCEKYRFDGYFQTSAKRGDGIAELQAELCKAIRWDDLPAVTRTVEFQDTKNFLLDQKRRGTIVESREELFAGLGRRRQKRADISPEVFDTCLKQLATTGLIRHLPFGDWVLLQPELLDDYSGWLALAAREEPDGLGHISEGKARNGNFPMDKDRPLAKRKKVEGILLLASVEEVLARGLAIREYDEKHRELVLVFPTELKSKLPNYPGGYSQVMAFRFSGPVRGIYASLVVKLIYSIPFRKHQLHRNAAIFKSSSGTLCGIAVEFPDQEDDSLGRLIVFTDHDTHRDTRDLFLRYINKQIEDMAFANSVQRERIYHCGPCNYTIDPKMVELARERKNSHVGCGLCDRKYPLDDLIEQAMQTGQDLDDIDQQAEAGQSRESRRTILGERRKRGEFHVFLCHNSKDKRAVRELAKDLADEGVLAWIDEEELLPGDVVQDKLERAIDEAGAIAVCIGPHKLGRWQTVEYHTVYERFIDLSESDDRGFRSTDRLRVIPVLLPGVTKNDIPAFLRRHHYADLSKSNQDARRNEMQKLVTAILAEPGRQKKLSFFL